MTSLRLRRTDIRTCPDESGLRTSGLPLRSHFASPSVESPFQPQQRHTTAGRGPEPRRAEVIQLFRRHTLEHTQQQQQQQRQQALPEEPLLRWATSACWNSTHGTSSEKRENTSHNVTQKNKSLYIGRSSFDGPQQVTL